MVDEITIDGCLAHLLKTVAAAREALASDTLTAIRSLFEIPVTERPEHRSDGLCAVDGSYFHTPPRIVVATSESVRRRAFTALHELAHHLIRNDWGLFGLAGDRLTEEDVCDRFAAEILLPTELVNSILSLPVPTAKEFAALYEQSHASRTVCARRVAAVLPCAGHAVVALGTTTTYCASAHTPFRAEFGVKQDADIFENAVRDGVAQGTARLRYSQDVLSPEFWADAFYNDEHVFAIFVERDSQP